MRLMMSLTHNGLPLASSGPSGDGVAWGGVTGDLGDQADLAAALAGVASGAAAAVAAAESALGAEIDLKADDRRVDVVSNFASPNAGGIIAGQYYDNCFHGSASGTLAGTANRMDLAPFYTSVPLTIDMIGCSVSTAVAASLFKIVIYDSGPDGWPNALLYESGDLSGAAAVFVSAALAFTFDRGKIYWVGVRHSSTCTLRTVAVAAAVNLGLTANNASNYATVLRRTLAYATPAPNPWGFVNADRVANVTPPSVRFRAA